MISVRSPLTIVALVAMAAAFATLASAHDHHHHHNGGGFSLWVAPNGKSMSENLKECLCWDTKTNTWCHDANDGNNKGFWRDSCARVVYANTWWWIPVVLWLMYLILLPFFMCAFRLCCNCCGGRTPSYGCCCPISNGVLSPDPKWKRPYSRCSTWCAKILAILVAAAFISLSVHTLVQNYNVTSDIHTAIPQLQTWIQGGPIGQLALADKTAYPVPGGPKWIKSQDLAVLEKVQTFVPTLETIQNDFGNVISNDNKYRRTPVKVLVGLVLALTIVVTLLGLCNVRSWPISISAGLLSIVTFVIVLWASTLGTASVAMNLYCDNQAEVQKFAVDALSGNGYCNVSAVSTAVNSTQVDYVKYLCQERGLAKLLTPLAKTAGNGEHSICDVVPGGMLHACTILEYPSPISMYNLPPYGRVNWGRLNIIIGNASYAAIRDPAFPKKVWSPYNCSFDKKCPQWDKWNAFNGEIAYVFNGLTYVDVHNKDCNWAKRILEAVVTPVLCGEQFYAGTAISQTTRLADHTSALAGLMFGVSLVATIAFWVWMNGSKRFTKAASKDELLGHHDMHRRTFQQMSYDYIPQQQQGQPQQQYNPEPQQGVVAVPSPRTQAVAATTEQPLLLDHAGRNYGGAAAPEPIKQDSNINRNSAPIKEQPEEIV